MNESDGTILTAEMLLDTILVVEAMKFSGKIKAAVEPGA